MLVKEPKCLSGMTQYLLLHNLFIDTVKDMRYVILRTVWIVKTIR